MEYKEESPQGIKRLQGLISLGDSSFLNEKI